LAEKPDVFFFTGDLVNDKAEEMEPWLDLFGSIEAPMGKFSILGNHDYGDMCHGQITIPFRQNWIRRRKDITAHPCNSVI
jgi:predicted MPP superfamily phosphohydrolase